MRSKRVEQRVRQLLSESEEYRNSDKKLFLEYIDRFYSLRLSPEQKALFMKATPFESISRARRAARADFPGNQHIEEARYNKFIEARDEYGQPIMIFKEAK